MIGIDNVQDGRFSLGSNHRISQSKFDELEKYRARPGDVAITVMATVGRTCVIPDDIEPAIITKHIYRITLNREVADPYFVMNALRGAESVLAQMGANVRGQTRPGINGSILKMLMIPTAPLKEQKEIVRRIDRAFAEIDRMISEAAAARRLLDRLDQAILAKAFQGELVPQDPADEPASVLLERIKAERKAAPRVKRDDRAQETRLPDGLQIMAKNLEQVLAETADWISAQDAFQRCGISSGATTEEIESIYAELRNLDKSGRIEVESVKDEHGRKLHDRLRLKAS